MVQINFTNTACIQATFANLEKSYTIGDTEEDPDKVQRLRDWL